MGHFACNGNWGFYNEDRDPSLPRQQSRKVNYETLVLGSLLVLVLVMAAVAVGDQRGEVAAQRAAAGRRGRAAPN